MDVVSERVAGYLVPSTTIVQTNGVGAPFELGQLAGQPLLIVLRIHEVIEQESLRLSVWGSPDAVEWGDRPLFWFPEMFYPGLKPAALNLSQYSQIKFLQARWEVNRWGRGWPRPFFKISAEVQHLD
jgi:hypothetical protein